MKDFKDYLLQYHKVPDDQMEALLSLFKHKEFQKNEFLAEVGNYCKKLYFLREGVMRAYYQNEEGVEYNKILFQAPCIVAGYSSLITSSPNLINIQSLSSCVTYECTFQDILDLYGENRDIETLNRVIAEGFFVQKERREMSLVMFDAKKRYELFLERFPGLDQEIPQYHIASYLGITPTQLSRIRNQSK